MAEKPSDPQQAMVRVLQAEREAEQAVATCEHEAHALINAAQVRANRITSRTDERITLIKMRSSQQLAGDIKRRERAEAEAYQQQIAELDESGLKECIAEVAKALTGGAPE